MYKKNIFYHHDIIYIILKVLTFFGFLGSVRVTDRRLCGRKTDKRKTVATLVCIIN